MREVAEFLAAEGVIAEILDDGAAVSVGMCLFDLVVGEPGKALEKQGAYLVEPKQIDDLFVGEYRIGKGGNGERNQCQDNDDEAQDHETRLRAVEAKHRIWNEFGEHC